MINVTKTFLPPYEEYSAILKRAWNIHWLTNRGGLTIELEKKIKEYLHIEHVICTTNGTLPLQIALKLFGENGEIITTPFSYVATTSAIVWEGCVPIYADIDEQYLTIDETKIEKLITNRTKAILATHVFGNPCNTTVIEEIAQKYGLKVIYDAAHCFGVKYKGESIFNYGDVSTCSFHATKLFHTGEGGAMFCKDPELRDKLYYSHNFGHDTPYTFTCAGINAKISELQSAMGLAVFPYLDQIIAERKKVVDYYDQNLIGATLQRLQLRKGTEWNYSYYPIIFPTENALLNVQVALNAESIFPRRYFYPSLNTVSYTNGKSAPISESVSKRILCLPLYAGLEEDVLSRICKIINN